MSKSLNIELFTLKALAQRESVTHTYLRKITSQFSKGEIQEWRGWVFISPGQSASSNLTYRNFWLAYRKGHFTVKIFDDTVPEQVI